MSNIYQMKTTKQTTSLPHQKAFIFRQLMNKQLEFIFPVGVGDTNCVHGCITGRKESIHTGYMCVSAPLLTRLLFKQRSL